MPSIRGFWQQWVFTDLPLYFNITKFHRSFNARRQTTLCMLCTAEVNMAFPKAHSVENGLLHQNGHDSQKNRQKCKADPGKQEKKTLSAIGNTARIFPKRNEACKRSHQCPCTAHIDANQKSAGILREATEQNGGRDIVMIWQVSAEISIVPWDKRRANSARTDSIRARLPEKVKKAAKVANSPQSTVFNACRSRNQSTRTMIVRPRTHLWPPANADCTMKIC